MCISGFTIIDKYSLHISTIYYIVSNPQRNYTIDT